jgi:ppGpp synthetase/RelA/SpoT-type nucleotidyltranferase
MINTKSILKEFHNKNDLYKDYGFAVKNLIESLLKKGNYKHQLSHRIKSVESLKEKIIRKKNAGKIYKKLSDIEDIVGIRVVFYTEIDRKRFMKNLSKAFGGDSHFEETSKVSGYRSVHAIVKFSKERSKLAEYRRFKGLKCEIQMTLILTHAWAEVEHDILYKEGSDIQGVDKQKYTILREKMTAIMNNYIQKASIGLESIVKNIKKLKMQKHYK